MKKILFFPSDMGGGFGHVGRCLDFAGRFRQEGCRIAFALNAFHAGRVEKQGFQTCLLGWNRESWKNRLTRRIRRPGPRGPAFYAVNGLDYQAVRDGIHSEAIAASRLGDCLRIIDAFRPDLLIGDTNLFVQMAGSIRQVPVLQIVRAAIHPDAAPRPAPRKEEEKLVRPSAAKVFNGLLSGHGLPPIQRAEDLLRGSLILIPAIQEVDAMPEAALSPTSYIGTLLFKEESEGPGVNPEALFPEKRKVVYITIGGGAEPEGSRWLFDLFRRVTQRVKANFIISLSPRHKPSRTPGFGSNTALFSWVRALDVMAKSDLVIFPGGYGTAMTVLSAGKPSLIIPSHSDPEWNGRNIQKLGAGLVLFPFTGKMETLEFPEPLGGTAGVYREVSLRAEDVAEKIDTLLTVSPYQEQAAGIAGLISDYKKQKAEKIFQKILKDML